MSGGSGSPTCVSCACAYVASGSRLAGGRRPGPSGCRMRGRSRSPRAAARRPRAHARSAAAVLRGQRAPRYEGSRREGHRAHLGGGPRPGPRGDRCGSQVAISSRTQDRPLSEPRSSRLSTKGWRRGSSPRASASQRPRCGSTLTRISGRSPSPTTPRRRCGRQRRTRRAIDAPPRRPTTANGPESARCHRRGVARAAPTGTALDRETAAATGDAIFERREPRTRRRRRGGRLRFATIVVDR